MTKILSTAHRFTLLLSICVTCTTATYILNEHQNFILDRVTIVLKTCLPATLSLLNEKAFPILTDDYYGITRAHVAGVEWGKGRIVAYSHSTFYINDLPDGSDNVKLLINSVNWCRKNASLKIGIHGSVEVEAVLSDYGFDVHVIESGSFNNLSFLEQFDALATNLVTGSSDGIRVYVQNGGGLVIAATGWNAKDGELESFWGNVVLRDSGIFFIRKYAHGLEICDFKCFKTSTESLQDTNAIQVWNDLKQFNWSQLMPRKEINQKMGILADRLRDGPINETLNKEVRIAVQRILPKTPAVVPSKTAPVSQEKEKEKLIAHKGWSIVSNLVGMTGNMPPHPAAIEFPGTAPSNSRSQRRAKEIIEIDGRINWHSTGLYALPGDEIKIQALNADSSMSDLEVQIGVHTDDIEKGGNWTRYPCILLNNRMKNGTASIANPLGGPIFIISSKHRNVSLKFSIKGAIRSPTYFLGQTKLTQWRKEIRNYPAPWGELVGKNLILSVQASLLSQLNDPEEVIKFWDRIVDAIADLAAISSEREWPQRFVADVQISAGWMHSGYPIMYHLQSQPDCINLTLIKKEPLRLWGFLHELGHNHQKPDWNFNGTGEVTCNLFALYVTNTIFSVPTNSCSYHSRDYSDATRAKLIKSYVENGTQFSEWQSNYDLAFFTYFQLQEAFGWSVYKKIFSNYQLLSHDERPINDQGRIDLWMVMFSRVVEENLSDFFISWGFPISAEAVALVSHLPPTSLRIQSKVIQTKKNENSCDLNATRGADNLQKPSPKQVKNKNETKKTKSKA